MRHNSAALPPPPSLGLKKKKKVRLPHWLGRMRFDECHPGFLQMEGGVVIATLLRCIIQEAKARGNFSVRRWHGAPAARPLIAAVLLLVISGVHAPHASALQQAWPSGSSGVRPGIVHSSPAAQSIVRLYCSSGRGVSWWGGMYWCVSCWGGTPCCARATGLFKSKPPNSFRVQCPRRF